MIPQATGALRRAPAALMAALLFPLCAQAQTQAQAPAPLKDYPRQAITLISPFPPGGGNDGVARLLANELGRITGQSVVVENRSGAGGNMGTAAVARAKPDGYTLVLSQNSVMAVNPAIYKNTGFDALKDFTPVSQITSAPLALVVRKESPYLTLADYLNDARARPGAVTYATPGNGTLSHLVGVVLSKENGVPMTHVPYKGAGPAINDLLGQQVDVLITSTSSVAGMIQAGQVRALAVTSPRRIGVFGKVPTLEELGLRNARFEDWYGFFAPAGTPPERVAYLHDAIVRTLQLPEVTKLVVDGGSEVVANTPEAFAAQLRQDMERWSRVVKLSGAKID